MPANILPANVGSVNTRNYGKRTRTATKPSITRTYIFLGRVVLFHSNICYCIVIYLEGKVSFSLASLKKFDGAITLIIFNSMMNSLNRSLY